VVLELVALAPACSTLASAAPLERTGGTGAACSTLASAAPRALELVELAPACSTLASAAPRALELVELAPACSTLASAAPRALELVELAPACSTLASAAPLERTGGAGAACSTLASAAPWCLSWWSWRRLQHAGRASGFRVATAQQADILFSVRAGGWLECLECPKSSKRGVATSKRGNKWGNKTEFWFSVSLQINGLHDEYGSDKPQLVQRPLGTYS